VCIKPREARGASLFVSFEFSALRQDPRRLLRAGPRQIDPTGKSLLIYRIVSSPKIKNISLFQKPETPYIIFIPSRSEGRIMIVRERGTGGGGRR
jgi:hypothetical protein